MNIGEVITTTVFITLLYTLCGVGLVSLLKEIRPDIPRAIGFIWPTILLLCAFTTMKDE